jgi:branched-chain amino acid transport system ATP-binding protein
MLVVENLCVAYGAVKAVRGVSLSVAAGEAVALIGPNGAGKTSIISAIAGLVASTGSMVFDGADLTRVSVEDRVRLGISVTPEGRKVFTNLTVLENLRLGAATRSTADFARNRDLSFAMFPRLAERREQFAGTLSGGEQQMLAIARSLMAEPRFLMLDEPSLGLAPRIIDMIFEHVAELKTRGLTLLLVEQNVRKALSIADRAYVLSTGEVRMSGDAAALRADHALVSAYLGG